MPEYVRAMIVVCVAAAAILSATKTVIAPTMPPGAFRQRRNACLALLVCGFLSPSFWLFAFLAAIIVIRTAGRQPEWPRSTLFLALLFVVPPAEHVVPGFELVNSVIALDYPRLLSLLLLVPAFLGQLHTARTERRHGFDRLFIAYFLLRALLAASRDESFTNGLRMAFYVFLDAFLPYYVLSRSLTRPAHLRDGFAAICMGAVVLGAIGLIEWSRSWLLFRSMVDHWGGHFGMGNYLVRGAHLRALASTGQPIVLGYVLAVAIPCLLGLHEKMRGRARHALAFAILSGGLFASLSRGPWLGAAVGALVFWAGATGSRLRLTAGAAGAIAALSATGAVSTLLPGIKDMDVSTVEYRSRLLTNSMSLFWRTPWLGSGDYVERLAGMGMVQGQGIVDIVNTYVGVALASGAVGLGLYGAAFALLLRAIWTASRPPMALAPLRQRAPAERVHEARHAAPGEGLPPAVAGRVLMGAIAAILVTIATVSSISVIPWVYWAFAGMGAAYVRMQDKAVAQRAAPCTQHPNASPRMHS